MATMKAAVLHEAGPPSNLKIERIPIPKPEPGWVLIHIKAFGLNRSEMFTRQGHSPGVKLPRVLGIEATGVVEDAPSGEFEKGDTVVTAMGGLGREFDGGYAEYTCTRASQVQKVDPKGLGWDMLAALPEMLQTAHGSLFRALQLKEGETLLIRGGTTSVGLAAAAIAKDAGCIVASSSRSDKRADLLRSAGAEHVVIDGGEVAEDVQKLFPGGVDKVLDLIGTTTLADSLRCAKPGGAVCMTGIVGGKWTLDGVNPMELIPNAVNLTVYSGGPAEFMETPLDHYAELIAAGKMRIHIGKVLKLDNIVEAHELMESNKAGGKIVLLT